MSLQRLLLSVAWKMFSHAQAQIKTAHRVRIPLRARGDFAALEEIFVQQAYVPLLAEIPGPILSWVDLGCNAGMFSAWLYDRACAVDRGAECSALLVDPGTCVKTAREFVRLNKIENFNVVQACIGDGAPTVFYESKSSTRSSSVSSGPLPVLIATPITSLSNNRAARVITSRWPLVIGSNVPGYRPMRRV